MKDFFKGIALITVSLILFPAVPCLIGVASGQGDVVQASVEISGVEKESAEETVGEVYLYDIYEERVITLTAEEYVASALAVQLPPETDPEVLKAQAVLMYTYILRRRLEEKRSPTPGLMGCDISNDTDKYPRLALDFGESADRDVFLNAAKEVLGEYCAYGGEPISVAYCRSAGTETESAQTVLGEDIPYLQKTPTYEPDAYYTTVTYTADEVFARLTTAGEGYVLLGGAESWITVKEAADSGYICSAYLDSRFIISGAELARLLNLPSARFTFRYSPSTERFTFTVSGSGSLVGFSQRGAMALAEQGYNYKELLLHYFRDIDIVSPKAPE